MKRLRVAATALLIVGAAPTMTLGAGEKSKDDAEIKTLEQRFAAAFKAKDLDSIMAAYVPDESLFVFDVIPPREYVGAKAYRKDWEDFFASHAGPIETFEINDLKITTNGELGFSHSIQRAVFTEKDGKKAEITFRVTDVYRKINGTWLIVHEHVSVPVDLATGKADLASKP